MTNPFTVTPEMLFHGARQCGQTNEQVQAGISSMRAHVEALRAAYIGPCAQQLDDLSMTWDSAAKRLNTVLTTIGSNLQATTNYVTNEEANAANRQIAATCPPQSTQR
jgi:WXG100 family type VII secretion target